MFRSASSRPAAQRSSMRLKGRQQCQNKPENPQLSQRQGGGHFSPHLLRWVRKRSFCDSEPSLPAEEPVRQKKTSPRFTSNQN